VVRRGEALVEHGRPSDAVALLQPLARSGPAPGPGEPLACRAAAALGRALRRDRQNGRSAEVLKPVVERCPAGPIRERALYVMASATAAAGQRDEAVALYRRFAREAPSSTLADDALFAAAELQARDGRPDQARATLGALLRDLPAGDRRDEARFRLAWLTWRAGDGDRALAELVQLDADAAPDDAYEHARAAYWRGRILAERGPAGLDEARALWAGLVEAAPADYYALLARARLAGRQDAALPDPLVAGVLPEAIPPEKALAPLAGDRHLLAGLALLRAGLGRQAAEELRAVERGVLPAGDLAPLIALAELLERARDLHAAHNLLRLGARAELRRPPQGPVRRLWEVAYPQAFPEEVARATGPVGVPRELLLALMREESALDPEVVSAAGAVGLTQLMPATARAVARRHRWPAPERAALTDPATSTRIGAAYLGELLVRFKGSPALALAAYNAGENAVERWRAAAAGRPLDEFVEEIPYDETRGYVKRVLRSYASYRLLAAPQATASKGGPAAAGP
jgi:soluble lytic murein transglycosylase